MCERTKCGCVCVCIQMVGEESSLPLENLLRAPLLESFFFFSSHPGSRLLLSQCEPLRPSNLSICVLRWKRGRGAAGGWTPGERLYIHTELTKSGNCSLFQSNLVLQLHLRLLFNSWKSTFQLHFQNYTPHVFNVFSYKRCWRDKYLCYTRDTVDYLGLCLWVCVLPLQNTLVPFCIIFTKCVVSACVCNEFTKRVSIKLCHA